MWELSSKSKKLDYRLEEEDSKSVLKKGDIQRKPVIVASS
jgi:hypothetical protein